VFVSSGLTTSWPNVTGQLTVTDLDTGADLVTNLSPLAVSVQHRVVERSVSSLARSGLPNEPPDNAYLAPFPSEYRGLVSAVGRDIDDDPRGSTV
jgi:hypothetical protein